MTSCVWKCVFHGSVNPEHLLQGFHQCKFKTDEGTNPSIMSFIKCYHIFKRCKLTHGKRPCINAVTSWGNMFLTTLGHFWKYLYTLLLFSSPRNRSQRQFCTIGFFFFVLFVCFFGGGAQVRHTEISKLEVELEL